MELLEGIETRKSIRAFKSTPVPEEIISKILGTARWSPSYKDSQPWEVVVVSGQKKEELSKILYELAKSGAAANRSLGSPEDWPPEQDRRIRTHGANRFDVLGVAREDAQRRAELVLENYKFYGAPCVLFLFMDSTLSSWSIFDMGVFTQSIILAAHSFGLGSCIQASLTDYPDAVNEFLGIPETKKLILGISIGYPDPEAREYAYRSFRISTDEFVKWVS